MPFFHSESNLILFFIQICFLGFMAIRYIPKKFESSDWTCLSGRCLYILCIEGNYLIIIAVTSKF